MPVILYTKQPYIFLILDSFSSSNEKTNNSVPKPAEEQQKAVNKFLSVVKYPFTFAPKVFDWSVKATLFAFSAVFYICIAMICLKVSYVVYKFFMVFAIMLITYVYETLFD